MQSVDAASRNPYASILGEAYASLDPAVRRAHEAPLSARGTLTVEHGHRWWTPILIRMMRLPAPGVAQPVRLQVTAAGPALTWTRRIGVSPLHTTQYAEQGRLIECSGIGRISFDLSVHHGSLVYRRHAVHVAGLRLPGPVSPHVEASVNGAQGGWSVRVEVTWRGHLVCRYAGIISAV